MKEYYCRICGFNHGSLIWGDDNETPSYEICECCGCEYGNDDYTLESIIRYRNKWFVNGFKWFKIKSKPNNWSIESQVKNIFEAYRE